MMTTRTTRRGTSALVVPLMAAGLMFAAVGCGGDDDSSGGDDASSGGDQISDESTADSAPTESTESTDTESGAASGEGLCVAVTSVDLTAAFGGELQFEEAKDSADREMCIVPIVGAEGEGLIVKVTTGENYAQLAQYEDQGLPFRQIDGLGEEAFILNDADLNVLLADGTAVQVAVQAFFVSGSPPDPSTIEPGLVETAEAVIASL